MTRRVSRRHLLATGAMAGASVAAGAALGIRGWHDLLPPDHQGVFGVGHTLTYAAQRLLGWRQPLAREFARHEISTIAPVNGDPPATEIYQRLLETQFADWRLRVEGLVARPGTFSLAEIMRMPARSQITLHVCEEGWSFIAEWTGVPLSHLLALAGASPRARFVVFFPFDQWWDSLDIDEARHPQTLLAYAMNGRTLPAEHGAPLRLRVPRQLGYKSIKYLSRIRVVDTLDGIGRGLGSASPENGYSWYAGI